MAGDLLKMRHDLADDPADRSPVRYRVADVLAWASDPEGHERAVWGEAKHGG